jgi:fumarate hydratase class I
MPDITNELVELVRLTSTDLPKSVQDALIEAREAEAEGSAAKAAMVSILENVEMSRRNMTPICQDTARRSSS